MTDAQLLTAALAVIIPVSSLIYSNSRISDVRKSIDEAKETLRAEMKILETNLSAQMTAGFERIEHALKVHELEHHK